MLARGAVNRMHLLLLALAVAAGFWLRWDGLHWGGRPGGAPGAGFVALHPDEPTLARIAAALHRCEEPRRSYVYGLPHLALALHAARSSGDAGGDVTEDLLIWQARLLSVGAGALLPLLLFAIARRLGCSPETSTWASALAALNTLCVIHSHYGTADMTYCALLLLFAWSVLRGWALAAAGLAGLAMATKFGLILVPSLIWLVARRWRGASGPDRRSGWLGALLILAVAGFFFAAGQGFHFNGENIRAILRSFRHDNVGGFEHAKWQNVITWSGVAVRSLGLPVFALAIYGLRGLPWRTELAKPELAIALLPFFLHGLGLLTINTTFPRHFLPLVPLLLIAAVRGLELLTRGQSLAGVTCVAWSAILAWSDGAVFHADPRERVAQEVQRLPAGKLWADPHYHLPLGAHRAERPSEADYLVLTEAWTWRFERSEVNPLRAPRPGEVYHANANDFAWYGNFKAPSDEWEKVAEAGPLCLLPEQHLYAAAWDSFEKFAGRCVLYRRKGNTQER